jgi:hypothetical protein
MQHAEREDADLNNTGVCSEREDAIETKEKKRETQKITCRILKAATEFHSETRSRQRRYVREAYLRYQYHVTGEIFTVKCSFPSDKTLSH